MLTLSAHILWLYDWNNEYCNFYRVAQFTSIVTATVLFVFLKKSREKCCRLCLNLGNIVHVREYLTAAEFSSTALWLWASDRQFSVARRRRSLPLCCSASHESIPSSRPTSQTEHSALSRLYPSPPPWPTERGVAQEGSESRHKLQNGQTEHEKLQRVTDERGKKLTSAFWEKEVSGTAADSPFWPHLGRSSCMGQIWDDSGRLFCGSQRRFLLTEFREKERDKYHLWIKWNATL